MVKRPWLIVLAALVLVDVVLVALAFRHTYAEPERADDPARVGSGQSGDEPTGVADASDGSPSGGASSELAAVAPLVSEMSAVGDLLLAADRGDCTSAGAIRVRAGDAAAENLVTRSPDGLRAVGSFVVSGRGQARLVGADLSCERLDLTTTDGGRSWERAEPGGVWALVPGDGLPGLASPDGPVDPPCPRMSSVVAFGSEVRVTCESGAVMGTSVAGASWDTLAELPDSAVATAWSTPSTLHVLVANPDADCALGVRVSADGGASLGDTVCTGLPGGSDVGLAASGTTVVVLSGDEQAVSQDGGASFG